MTGFEGKRILIVEDEAMIALMIEDMLIELGAVVLGPASSLAKGFAAAAEQGIDAAVLDVNLRGERVEPLAALLRARAVPLVFASGYGDTVVAAEGEMVIEKPFRLDCLQEALACALARGALRVGTTTQGQPNSEAQGMTKS